MFAKYCSLDAASERWFTALNPEERRANCYRVGLCWSWRVRGPERPRRCARGWRGLSGAASRPSRSCSSRSQSERRGRCSSAPGPTFASGPARPRSWAARFTPWPTSSSARDLGGIRCHRRDLLAGLGRTPRCSRTAGVTPCLMNVGQLPARTDPAAYKCRMTACPRRSRQTISSTPKASPMSSVCPTGTPCSSTNGSTKTCHGRPSTSETGASSSGSVLRSSGGQPSRPLVGARVGSAAPIADAKSEICELLIEPVPRPAGHLAASRRSTTRLSPRSGATRIDPRRTRAAPPHSSHSAGAPPESAPGAQPSSSSAGTPSAAATATARHQVEAIARAAVAARSRSWRRRFWLARYLARCRFRHVGVEHTYDRLTLAAEGEE